MQSVPATIAWWVEANAARSTPAGTSRLPDRVTTDNCVIERNVYPAKDGDAVVETYAESIELAWSFLSKHRR